MSDQYETIHQILRALKKQRKLETKVLIFYTANLLYMFGAIITMSVFYFMDKIDVFIKLLLPFSIFNLLYYTILFIADIVTITYFIQMAKNYINILNNFYPMNRSAFLFVVYFITVWIVLT